MIEVTVGAAEVRLHGAERTSLAAGTSVTYRTDDLLEAVRRALLAAEDPRAGAVEELLR